MLRSSALILTLAATALAAGAASADVYKYKDERGNVLYTDKPATLPAERLNVQSQKTDVVAVQARQDADQKRQQDADKGRQQADGAKPDQAPTQLSTKDKADRCTQARDRYDTYRNSQKLYETLPNGERRYLSDIELDAARAAAKTSMDTLCQ